jgi:hypothetical protein
MPVSTIIFLYGISVLAGAMLVVYGLSQKNGKKAASPDPEGCCAADDLPVATLDAVPLRFLDEEAVPDDPLPGVSRRDRRRFDPKADAGPGSTGKGAGGISRVFTAPFRGLSRLVRRGGGEGLDRPVTFKLHLDARDAGDAGAKGEAGDAGKAGDACDKGEAGVAGDQK